MKHFLDLKKGINNRIIDKHDYYEHSVEAPSVGMKSHNASVTN